MYAITRKHIKYFKYNVKNIIGIGRTSIVLDYDSYVIMLTRDKFKSEWYKYSLFGELLDIQYFEDDFKEFPIYIWKLPKLYPLLSHETATLNKNIIIPIRRKLMNYKTSNLVEQNKILLENIPTEYPFYKGEKLKNFILEHSNKVIIDMNSSNIMADEMHYYFTDVFFSIDLLKVFLPFYYHKLIKE